MRRMSWHSFFLGGLVTMLRRAGTMYGENPFEAVWYDGDSGVVMLLTRHFQCVR